MNGALNSTRASERCDGVHGSTRTDACQGHGLFERETVAPGTGNEGTRVGVSNSDTPYLSDQSGICN